MKFINVDDLEFIGSGAFSRVYRLSPTEIIKVYFYYNKCDINIMAEEIELSMTSDYALPVLNVAVAINKKRHHYAVIKKYLPREATVRECRRLEKRLPKCLRRDCYCDNARVDEKGNVFLIDTQGPYAFGLL